MRSRNHALSALVLLIFCSAAQAQLNLKLDAQAAQNFGVLTELLVAAQHAPARTIDAHVLDPSALYAQFDDVQMRSNAVALSSAQAARIARLYRNQQNATQAALAQATLAAQSDQSNHTRAQTVLRATWGDAVAAWSAPETARRLNALRGGHASFVRAELDTALVAGTTFAVDAAPLELIGLLPAADPQTGRAGALLWLTRGLPALSRLQVDVSGAGVATTSVLIPRSAILRLNGGNFAFVQTAGDAYLLRELTLPERTPEGWLVQSGFVVGERVVTSGAASLLTMARGAGQEEDE